MKNNKCPRNRLGKKGKKKKKGKVLGSDIPNLHIRIHFKDDVVSVNLSETS